MRGTLIGTLAAMITLAAMMMSVPAYAALPVGAKAPDFTAPASLGGRTYTFSLADALRKGPVVLYFYPAAFTKGCTIEAHDFADAMDDFRGLHATVIGVSEDSIAILKKFSVSACRSKFPVAADQNRRIAREYDAILKQNPARADRTSYVIAPSGRIIFTYTSLDPDQHVVKTIAAVRLWSEKHGQE